MTTSSSVSSPGSAVTSSSASLAGGPVGGAAPPPGVLSAAALRALVAAACRAPSLHNSQPWRWRRTASGVALFADRRRQLRGADRSGRELVLSCGAALEAFVVAARAAGYAAQVRRLPDPGRPDLLASVSLHPSPAGPDARPLAEAVAARRTDRREPSSWPVPAGRLEHLAVLARERGVLGVPVTDPEAVARLAAAQAEASAALAADPDYAAELARWTHGPAGPPPQRAHEGVPADHRPRGARADAPATTLPAGTLADERADEEPSGAAWLVLAASSDDALSWLRTGEALMAGWLWATRDGLALVPYSQAMEHSDTRDRLARELLDDHACPQLLLRLGWPPVTREPLAPTPRRPVDEVFDDGSGTSGADAAGDPTIG